MMRLSFLAVQVALTGCARLQVDEYAVADPLEKGNRVSYEVVEVLHEREDISNLSDTSC